MALILKRVRDKGQPDLLCPACNTLASKDYDWGLYGECECRLIVHGPKEQSAVIDPNGTITKSNGRWYEIWEYAESFQVDNTREVYEIGVRYFKSISRDESYPSNEMRFKEVFSVMLEHIGFKELLTLK